MKFNYGLEKKRFDAEWERLRREYLEAGMSEIAIKEMYEYDLKAFNRRRAVANHEQSLEGMRDSNLDEVSEDRNPLLIKFTAELSTSDTYFFEGRYAWIETICNEELYIRISALSNDDKELLTLYVMDGLTKRDIAKSRGVTEQAVGQKIKRLRNILFGV
mgnify:CR=1 FL=1